MYHHLSNDQRAIYENIINHIGWSLDSLKGYDNIKDYHQGLWSEKQAYCVENGLLTGLRLKQTAFEDSTLLKDLHALVDLNLEECGVDRLAPVSFAPTLKSINLAFNEIKNLDLLNTFTALETINLKGCRFGKIPLLNNLKNLTWINLEYNKIEDISNLENLNQLQYLNLSENNIHHLEGMQQLQGLEELWVRANAIKNLAPLCENKQLQKIVASNNYHISGFEALAALDHLEHLSLDDSLLLTVEGIGALKQLKSLDVQSNRLTALGEITQLEGLESLNLNMNAIEDITPFPIHHFKELKHFYIAQNKLEGNTANQSIIEQIKAQVPHTSFTF